MLFSLSISMANGFSPLSLDDFLIVSTTGAFLGLASMPCVNRPIYVTFLEVTYLCRFYEVS